MDLGARSGLRLHAWGAWARPAARAWFGGAPDWVRFQLPDGLWQLGFGLAMAACWDGAPDDARRRRWLALPAVLGLGTEVGQGLGVLEGVFDPWDVVALAAGAALAWAIACSSGSGVAESLAARSIPRGPEAGHLRP